ncbi:MAG: chorismate synthase [Acidobacteria bacterium SCN 69-37]|nr:MAG: chorismate synthase [Acidobacteria bacterium SCN 69-37]
MLRFLTAGESHGPALVVIVDGVPAGLYLGPADLTPDLARRQLGYGRGRRMAIETDRAEVLSGVRHGQTIGSPIALQIKNKDWTNWQHTMSVDANPDASLPGARRAAVTRPRPGHADLSAGLKYERTDLRDILERASARETAARVAAGAVARALLRQLGIEVTSHVTGIGPVLLAPDRTVTFDEAAALAADDDLRCVDGSLAAGMRAAIDDAKAKGDTVGGSFEVIARGVPPGLGSHTQWDRKLDGRLAQALMSIQAIKAVGVGLGPAVGHLPGSAVHDEILPGPAGGSGTTPGIIRPTNHAGGFEGGVTNGEDVRVSAWMKPISTLMKPLRSVDLVTLDDSPAAIERSDTCAVPAASVVGEAMLCLVLADAMLEKFGADTMTAIDAACRQYAATLRQRLMPPGPRA